MRRCQPVTRVAGREGETESRIEIPLDEIYALPRIAAFRVSGTSGDHIEQLVASMGPIGFLGASPEDPPPITVFERTKRGWPLGDGAHRLAAAYKLGWTKIQATVVYGLSEDEQLLFAIRANATHGLRYGPDDARVVARAVISIHPEWSDRRIAQESGTTHPTVGKVRAEMEASGGVPPGKAFQVTRDGRVGRDEKPHPTRGAATAKAQRVLEKDPTASVREVAKKAGVSPATAQQAKRHHLALVGKTATPADADTPPGGSEEAPTSDAKRWYLKDIHDRLLGLHSESEKIEKLLRSLPKVLDVDDSERRRLSDDMAPWTELERRFGGVEEKNGTER
jgi:ParB-like chromosome segregation protein Spo0J